MAGLTPFQFSSGKRMYNTTFGLSTSAYGTNLFADTVKDTLAWQEMWINPNNIKWESNYRQSQKQTAQSIVTFHFRPDYQILTCSGTAGWYRIKSQVEELKEQAIKRAISWVPNTASSDQLKKDKSDRNNKHAIYLSAQTANTNATNKHSAVSSCYGETTADSICGYLTSLSQTLTQNHYGDYKDSMVESLYSKQKANYLLADSTTSFVTMFDYNKDDFLLCVKSLISAYELMSVSYSDKIAASNTLSTANTNVINAVSGDIETKAMELSTYISTLSPSTSADIIIETMSNIYESGVASIIKSYNTAISNMMSATKSLFDNKAASTLTITGMSSLYLSHLDTLFSKLKSEIKTINDASYDDDVLKAYTKIASILDDDKSIVVSNYNSFTSAAVSTLNVYISHKDDASNLKSAQESFNSASEKIKSSAKTQVQMSETELKQANSTLAVAKSNYEAAAQKYKNSKGGLKTAAKSIKSSYSNGFLNSKGHPDISKASAYLKSGHSNRINNSPSLFLSRLKLTADEPLYYIDGDGVEHYNPKYIKMFTKQYPDGVIYEGYFTSFNINELPDFETVSYDFRFVAEKKTPVTFLQRVLGMYSGYTSIAGDALNVVGS